jgi:hypothetical protein
VKIRTLLSTLAIALIPVALSHSAAGQESPTNYNLNLNGYCEFGCASVSSGWPAGGPASASAQFTEMVTYSFQTLDATSYVDGDDYYYAQFGSGGTFELTAPFGTFDGTITSGYSEILGGSTAELAAIQFTGYWNTGVFASGSAEVEFCGDCIDPGYTFSVNMSSAAGTTPEPSSLVLFGSGIVGLAGWLRRGRIL